MEPTLLVSRLFLSAVVFNVVIVGCFDDMSVQAVSMETLMLGDAANVLLVQLHLD